jgi:hypothetical protein
MLIGVNGFAGSGKDTIGLIVQYIFSMDKQGASIEQVCADPESHAWWLEEQSGWEVRKFAGKLKDIASHLTGIEIENFEDQEFKKTLLGPEWNNMTVREFLQKLGTDALRDGLHPNTWVNALMADYKETDEYSPDWIITDVRFPNEAQAIKDNGGIMIRVDKPGVEAINNHPSETSLNDWKFDYKVVNISDIYTLKTTIENILKHANIL